MPVSSLRHPIATAREVLALSQLGVRDQFGIMVARSRAEALLTQTRIAADEGIEHIVRGGQMSKYWTLNAIDATEQGGRTLLVRQPVTTLGQRVERAQAARAHALLSATGAMDKASEASDRLHDAVYQLILVRARPSGGSLNDANKKLDAAMRALDSASHRAGFTRRTFKWATNPDEIDAIPRDARA